VQPDQEVKSIGHEETFPVDVSERSALEHEIVRLADAVASRLRAAHASARTVQLKLRYGDFRTITRSRTLAEATDLAGDIGRVARELLGAVDVAEGVRLLGISGQQLVRRPPASGPTGTADDQGQLFDEGGAPIDVAAPASTRQAAVERSLDEIRAKFGSGAVGPGGANSLQREGPGRPAR
jgi:DNA polymerase-4